MPAWALHIDDRFYPETTTTTTTSTSTSSTSSSSSSSSSSPPRSDGRALVHLPSIPSRAGSLTFSLVSSNPSIPQLR
ncbi:hypothetical protein K431DRAFT_18060 [Polychaeton citri CBS 116435]|uniref:Uncharacterized protein n=1 Tax=Polychaeton citri CBS 116435 TaxID=1314669 RepID=A0A9P4Q173_9PEZI|nr:hypothetical protein K431DRAFT_18060 [Polychaeton citri CBS 116435]